MNIIDAFYRRPGKNEVSGGKLVLPKKIEAKKIFQIRNFPTEGSFNEKIAAFYAEKKHNEDIEVFRKRALKKLMTDRGKTENAISNLMQKVKEYDNFEQYKEIADIIMSNIQSMKKGDTQLKTTNFFDNNSEIIIELNSTLSPKENAEKYYKLFKKAKSGIEIVKQDLENQNHILLQISKNISKIELESDISVLKDFLSLVPMQKQKDNKEQVPGLQYQSGGFLFYVGRSAKENDTLLRKYVRGNDIWLHTRDYPGGYVFIKTIKGKSVPLNVLLDAGNLALFYSKGRASGRGELYYTQVKYLRRAKNGPLGLVLPTQEKNLSIVLNQSRLSRMMGNKALQSFL